jgi:hypothetical protein
LRGIISRKHYFPKPLIVAAAAAAAAVVVVVVVVVVNRKFTQFLSADNERA